MASAVTADDTTEETRKRRDRELLLALFLLLVSDCNHELTAYCSQYLAGTISLVRLQEMLTTHLTSAHAHAAYLGRRLAGNRQPFSQHDQQFGAWVMYGQVRFLQGLIGDLRAGRYGERTASETPDTTEATVAVSAALSARLSLYAIRLRGTANEAWTLSLPPDTLLDWVLGEPETHHCQTCPERAASGPYLASRISFWPGDGTSECGVRCLCEWQIAGGGGLGFPPYQGQP